MLIDVAYRELRLADAAHPRHASGHNPHRFVALPQRGVQPLQIFFTPDKARVFFKVNKKGR